ncbi:MAG: phosphoglycerate kinase [Candidatus Jorgensenbacteria bacterium]|nr:phosphoglycerate kinase [Candidatus Jorgensenbacteria bacterium]
MRILTPKVLKQYKGKVCLLRADLDVPDRERKNSLRLQAVMETVRLLLSNGVRVVLIGHLGRPAFFGDKKYSFHSMSKFLSQELMEPIRFSSEHNFKNIKKEVRSAPARLFLIENLRYSSGEENNDKEFAKELASIGDFYVNEAFGVSHRAHASLSGVTRFLPSFAGPHLNKELVELGKIMKRRVKPFVVIIGGAKISDKLGVIKNFWGRTDKFLLGGGPANTMLAAEGVPMGDSLVDYNSLDEVKKYAFSPDVILPTDVEMKGTKVLDIGPETTKEYVKIIRGAKTIIWSGPMGMFEKKGFEEGTQAVWKAVLANKKAHTVVGGGDTLASLKLLTTHYELPTNLFLSTGGGAMLEFLSGKKLPGVEALK